VEIALTDLQEMHNHMCETMDQGMTELQNRQGHGALPAVPPAASGPSVPAQFTANAPAPDANAASEINELTPAADQLDQSARGS
jgi:hypothetical protein